MRKFFYTFGVIAATAAMFSCQKLAETPSKEEQPAKKMVTVSFSAEKPGETKTAAIEGEESVTYEWTDGDTDNMKLFIVGEDSEGKETLTEVANPTVTIVSATKLTISAEVEANATYTFRAILCDPTSYTGSEDDYGKRKPKIKANQNPNGTVNFDPTADILVSDDKVVTVGETAEDTGDMLLTFDRPVVVNKMTLKNLVRGEKVSKVVVTSTNSNGEIQGYYDFSEKVMKPQTNGNTITLYYDDVEVPEGGLFPVYFVTKANEGLVLKVDVTTDQHVYTKSFAEGKSINFILGQFTRFNVGLPEGTAVEDFANGDYFITGMDTEKVYAALAYVSGNNLRSMEITLDAANETIASAAGIEDCIFTFTKVTDVEDFVGKYTIQDANGKYLYAAGGNSNNQLKAEDTPDANGNAYWSVSKNADGTYAVEAAGNATRNVMRFNPTIFSCYASGQQPVTLYPASWCDIDRTPVISFNEEELSKTVAASATSVTFAYSANRYVTQAPSVAVATDEGGMINGTPTASNGVISVALNANTSNAEKTATLTVSGEGLSSPVTLTITQAAAGSTVSATAIYTVTSTSAVTTSGEVPTGSSATYSSTYTNKCQLTKGNSMTLTLSGYAGKKITGLVLSMKSNKSGGAGYMSMVSGSTTLAAIGSSSNGINFNNASWNGAWSTEYVDITVPVTATTIGNDATVVITIGATVNSLYCESFSVTYE